MALYLKDKRGEETLWWGHLVVDSNPDTVDLYIKYLHVVNCKNKAKER